jgi:hypothetical protein
LRPVMGRQDYSHRRPGGHAGPGGIRPVRKRAGSPDTVRAVGIG